MSKFFVSLRAFLADVEGDGNVRHVKQGEIVHEDDPVLEGRDNLFNAIEKHVAKPDAPSRSRGRNKTTDPEPPTPPEPQDPVVITPSDVEPSQETAASEEEAASGEAEPATPGTPVEPAPAAGGHTEAPHTTDGETHKLVVPPKPRQQKRKPKSAAE